MKELRIIIAGGREFNDYSLLKTSVNKILKEQNVDLNTLRIISGVARGADRLGEQFAKENKIALTRFPANWDRDGKRAGYIRNTEMALFATKEGHSGMLVAFWDGASKGTKHMIDTARALGLTVHIIRY